MNDTTRNASSGGPTPSGRARPPAPRPYDPGAPLPLDPELASVTLANGFTALVRRHPRPAGAVSLCLQVRTGSLDEEDDERGISHFLEHMAFRGSTNFPPGALQQLFAARGTRVGRHQNASTGLDRTSFRLSIPDADDRALGAFVLCLADFAYRLTLLPGEVERERRVILEEIRARSRPERRLRERVVGVLLPGSRLAARQPLGTEESVRALTAEQLARHYEKWHRPDNSTLVVVGDVDPARVEELVRVHFDPWAPAGPSPGRADPGARPFRGTRAAVLAEPDAGEAEARVLAVLPRSELRTVGDFRARLAERLALWLVNRRINTLVREGNAAFRDAQVSLGSFAGACTLARASAGARGGAVVPALDALLVELRRSGVHAPAAAELARAREALLVGARQAVIAEANRGSESLIAELEETVGERRTPVAKTDVVELARTLLPGISGDEVREVSAATFVRPGRLIVAVVPDAASCGREELLAAARSVRTRRVAPPRSRPGALRLVGRRPAPGRVADLEEDEELGLLSATLENGVRVHLREMTYRRERVFVTVTVAGGRIREGPADLGVTSAAALAWSEPASARYSSVAIRDWMGGRALAFETSVEEDALELRLAADPVHVEDGLQLIHLLLTSPRVEDAALQRWRERAHEAADSRNRSLEIRLAERALALLTGGDPRFRLLTAADVAAVSPRSAQRWLDEVVRPAPLEAAIVGDLPRARMLELALRYLGSLPRRPRRDQALDALRTLPRLRGPALATVEVDAEPSAAAVLVGWRAVPWRAVRDRHALQMAEQVLLERVRSELREARGMSYSPEVAFTPSRAYAAASLLSASTYAAPSRTGEAAEILRQVVARLAAEGPTEEEMATVRKQFGELSARAQRDPKYWCRVLADLDYHGARLAEVKRTPSRFAACTADELREVLTRVVTEGRRIGVTCVPRGA